MILKSFHLLSNLEVVILTNAYYLNKADKKQIKKNKKFFDNLIFL